ncbi:MAG: ribosome maturation factor RimP [Micromonosporaceae bacterium]
MAQSGRSGAATGLTRQKQRLRSVVEPAVTSAGYDLDDLAVSRAGGRSVVRVVVDGEDGVSSDAIADISREVSAALDTAEETEGPISPSGYTLEVSSPGIDRPLTEPRHWRRNRGRLVKVKVDRATRTGRVLAADDAGIRLDVAGEELELPYDRLGPGKVQIEFGRPSPPATRDDGDETDEGKEEDA